jgi:hypothetical protein
MSDLRARFATTAKYAALVGAALLVSATCTLAAPITVGTFELLNDTTDPFFAGPTFVVTNNSVDTVFPGFSAVFGSLHLVLDGLDLSTQDFVLTDALAPSSAIQSDGLVDAFGQSLLPDLTTLADAYLTLTLLDPVTLTQLAGTVSLGPTDPSLCSGCTTRMTDFSNGSTLAIQFEPAPTDVAPVPEPMSLVLVGSGLAACGAARRRRRETPERA